ncbi:MAG: MBL fold metallo-hydrolase [Verrucomicrobiota bacterium]|nr:MBL fold metallo-hydrolase [Verrucomicrobiota bacterium]
MNSAEAVIKKFGGQSKLARMVGKNQSTVQYWASKGIIPSKWQVLLLKLAREKSVSLTPSDFIAHESLTKLGSKSTGGLTISDFPQGHIAPAPPAIAPGTYLERIKKASEGSLVLCFVGVGSAFARKNDQTSLIIAKNGVTLLVDVGTTTPAALHRHGMHVGDFDYYHITHSHADHIGGLEELLLLNRYVRRKKTRMIIAPNYQKILWENSLKGGCEMNEPTLLRFTDLVDPLWPEWCGTHPRETYSINIEGLHLNIFRTIHTPGDVTRWEVPFWSTGLVIDRKVLFTADTRFDANIFTDLDISQVESIFHDCQLFNPGVVHAAYDDLKTLSPDLRNRTFLTHYGDNYDQFDPRADGFAGFAEAFRLYTWKIEQ